MIGLIGPIGGSIGSTGSTRGVLLAAGYLAAAIVLGLALPRGAAAQALSHAQLQALNDKLSTEFGYYLGAEEERHADGKSYIDLSQRFEYMPSRGRGGGVVVHAKCAGAEYVPNKGEMTKGIATGKIKYLLFTYDSPSRRMDRDRQAAMADAIARTRRRSAHDRGGRARRGR